MNVAPIRHFCMGIRHVKFIFYSVVSSESFAWGGLRSTVSPDHPARSNHTVVFRIVISCVVPMGSVVKTKADTSTAERQDADVQV